LHIGKEASASLSVKYCMKFLIDFPKGSNQEFFNFLRKWLPCFCATSIHCNTILERGIPV